jgi:xanthine dehydrogenase YagS FAD-binding subunit
MNAFELAVAKSLPQAIRLLAEKPDRTQVLAGGTDLLGMMKERLHEPDRLVSIGAVPGLDAVEPGPDGSLRIGALARLERLRRDPAVASRHAALAEAISTIATPQIRNMATLGGNLCQRPRCWYLRGHAFDCTRKGGSLCFSIRGENQYHAVLGGSGCYIVHPSDAAPALIALGASVTLAGPEGERSMPLEAFFVGPRVDIHRENVLKPGEILTWITLPASPATARSRYVKFTQRGAWDFALTSAAVRVDLEGGVCREARICLGGVAPVPWRPVEAEKLLEGRRLDERAAARAAEAALAGSRPMSGNAYKIRLAKTAVKRALAAAAAA